MDDKQDAEEKSNGEAKKDAQEPKEAQPAHGTPLTKKQLKGLFGIVFFRRPFVSPRYQNTPNSARLPPTSRGQALPHSPGLRGSACPVPHRATRIAILPQPRSRHPPQPSAPHGRSRRPASPPGPLRPAGLTGRHCYRGCREAITPWRPRATSAAAVPAARTAGTNVDLADFATGREPLSLNRSVPWIQPPPSPARREVADAAIQVEANTSAGIADSAAPQTCEASEWRRTVAHSIDSHGRFPKNPGRTPARGGAERSLYAHRTTFAEAAGLGSARRIHSSQDSSQEGRRGPVQTGSQEGYITARDRNRPTKGGSSVRLPSLPYVFIVSALVLTVLCVCVLIFSPVGVQSARTSDVGGYGRKATTIFTTTVEAKNETEPLLEEINTGVRKTTGAVKNLGPNF